LSGFAAAPHRLWANGEAGYQLANSDYNYWTREGSGGANPGTAALPVIDTDQLIKKTQIFPAPGWRNTVGAIDQQGYFGRYWLSTPGTSTNGYVFYISSSNMQPVNTGYDSAQGNSIRCVRI
jgi:hypothetical protein